MNASVPRASSRNGHCLGSMEKAMLRCMSIVLAKRIMPDLLLLPTANGAFRTKKSKLHRPVLQLI